MATQEGEEDKGKEESVTQEKSNEETRDEKQEQEKEEEEGEDSPITMDLLLQLMTTLRLNRENVPGEPEETILGDDLSIEVQSGSKNTDEDTESCKVHQ